MIDTNAIVRVYLAAQTALTAIVSARIYCPRIPQKGTLPALGFFTRGGSSTPYIPGIPEPSVQFDCWAASAIGARALYNALYNALQGIQNQIVTVSGSNYSIMSAIEEVQGQDIVDIEIPEYFRVMTFFKFMIRAE